MLERRETGIYSLSPYTLEEVVARNYLVRERPDAILNIIDGTNLERNLYLTTQLMELGIPVVAAVNMMDVVRRSGDRLDTKKLSDTLGCPVVEISAVKGENVMAAAEQAVAAASGAYGVHCGYDASGPDRHGGDCPHDSGQKDWQRRLRVRLQGLRQRPLLPSAKGRAGVQIPLSPVAVSPAI